MKVPFVDLAILYARQRASIDRAIAGVLASQRFILGPEVAGFEGEVEAYLGDGRRCLGVSNGSDAIALALMGIGIVPGDEVIVPAYTFAATATSVSLVGATPVFVDVDRDSLNIEPGGVADAVTPRTRAVVGVDLFGRTADWSSLTQAVRGQAVLIEDTAQAFGAAYNGRAAGTLAPVSTFSFFPAKNLGCFGDGGMIATDDDALYERLSALRIHGRTAAYHHEFLGLNSRLDALQAAVLRVRLRALDGWVGERREHASEYRERLEGGVRAGHLRLPVGDDSGRYRHSYNQFNLRILNGRRDALKAHLSDAGIATAIYYPTPLPYQPCFGHLGHTPGDFPSAEAASRESLALPVYPGLSEAARAYVAEQIMAFFCT